MLSISSVFLLVGAFCILTGVPVFICAKRLIAEYSKFSVERSKIELNNSTYLEQFDKEHEHLLFKKVNLEKLLLLGVFLLVLGNLLFYVLYGYI
ncbi:hypothetical protein Mgra_00006801 [Meloidogyne graminicola]|uniref:DUF3899 domain-containing protein n=1 Tax=Meloidogyne graminicola TaxID=189291 RepID=A0A8S9ZKN5_9BILA|nr:hypothetical protein Mgra_00006801 [Meloidogyne graminicola]